MKSRKLLAVLAAGIMTLSMAGSVFAEDTTVDVTSVEQTGSSVVSQADVKLPRIKVAMPSSFGFTVNPYKVGESEDTQKQIVSTETKITNYSEVPVKVKCAQLAATTSNATDPSKAPVYVEEAANVADDDQKGVNLKLAYTTTQGNYESGDAIGVKAFNAEDASAYTVNKDLATLAKATSETEAAAQGTVYMKYDGSVNNKSAQPWLADDQVIALAVFTFDIAAE